jgi:hypothetical protein
MSGERQARTLALRSLDGVSELLPIISLEISSGVRLLSPSSRRWPQAGEGRTRTTPHPICLPVGRRIEWIDNKFIIPFRQH